MRKFSKREKFLIGSFIVVLVIYIVSTYWITPLMEKIDELENRQAELKAQWDEIKNWIGREDVLHQKVRDMEEEVKGLVERIPSAGQSALYWNAFYQIARETGVAITRMVEQSRAGKTWQATLDISGPESAVMNFSDRLQNMKYVTAVKSGTFTYQGSTVLVTYELVLGMR